MSVVLRMLTVVAPSPSPAPTLSPSGTVLYVNDESHGGGLFFDRVQSLGPTIAAVLVLIGVVVTVVQKHKTDRRTLWWSRVEWAADNASAVDPDSRAVGQAALNALASEATKDEADAQLLAAIVDTQLATLEPQRPSDVDVEFVVEEG